MNDMLTMTYMRIQKHQQKKMHYQQPQTSQHKVGLPHRISTKLRFNNTDDSKLQ